MAIQWADDFSRYGTGSASRGNMLDGLPYAVIGSSGSGGQRGEVIADPDTNVTGRCFSLGTENGNDWSADFRIAVPTPVSDLIAVATRVWFPRLPTSDSDRAAIIQYRTVGGTTIAYIRVEQNGSIQVIDSGGVIGDTIVPVITPNAWHHYEFRYDCSTGDGELYINGVKRLDITGGDTGTCAIISFSYRNGSTGSNRAYLKDTVVADDTGSENAGVIGTVIVGRLKPIADVTLGGWVPSVGSTGFDLLDKDDPDDATYLEGDDAPPSPMQYTFESLPDDVTSVRALIPVIRMRKVDGGDAQVQTALSPNGTDWDSGADRAITSTFAYWFDISEVSPDTTDPWTPVEVNSIIGEIDRTV